jgi:predicted lysophospholipase L1 biosynthesis ABC-type transport system permease subunit
LLIRQVAFARKPATTTENKKDNYEKKISFSRRFLKLRVLLSLVVGSVGVVLALIGFGLFPITSVPAAKADGATNLATQVGGLFTHLTTTFQRPCAKWQPGCATRS